MREIQEKLKAYFPVERIKWRTGSLTKAKDKCIALAYIDARDVMDRLDEAVGFGNWSCEYRRLEKANVCRITIQIPDKPVFYVEDGAEDTNIEASKGGLSDAFKRAGVKLGIGRYLYDIENKWTPIDQYKKIIDNPTYLLPNFSGKKPEEKKQTNSYEKKPSTSKTTQTEEKPLVTQASLKKAEDLLNVLGLPHDQILRECSKFIGKDKKEKYVTKLSDFKSQKWIDGVIKKMQEMVSKATEPELDPSDPENFKTDVDKIEM